MQLQELLEYLDGNGLVLTDADLIEQALKEIDLQLDSEIAPIYIPKAKEKEE